MIARAPRVKLFRMDQSAVRFLTFEETPRSLAAVSTEWRTYALVALNTSLRLGELLSLKWEDLDLVGFRLVVRRTPWQRQEHAPKGGRTREVPFSDEAIAALKALRHLRGPYVFCEADGGRGAAHA